MAGLPSRAFHTAQPMPGGSALLIGGLTQGMDAFQTLNTSLRYAPGSEPAFVEVPLTPQEPRHGMTLVPYGDFTTVLLWGGNRAPVTPSDPGAFSEILQWDANGDVHARTPPFVTSQRDKGWPGFYGAAAALPSGQILVTGGMVVDKSFRDDDLPRPQQTFRLLDMTPQSETVLDTADRVMTSPRAMHTATLLERSDIPGEVLLTGGILSVLGTSYSFLDSAEFYSPVDGRFQSHQVGSQVIKLTLARTGHTATPLDDGTVLILGGFTTSPTITQTAEVYNPAPRELRLPASGGGQ
jgi:hypothetical protein